jgi:DNA repair protein RadC
MSRKKQEAVKSEDSPVYATGSMTDDEILRRAEEIARERLAGREEFTNPAQTRRYLSAAYRHAEREVFGMLLLNSQHEMVAPPVVLFHGTIDGASVYPREVVKEVLRHNAAAVVFFHNHPSGVAEPSTADRQITRRLTDALALIDVRVLDHFVIGATECVSFAERGLI